MSGSIDHLDFDPYSFAEHVSRLSLAMRDLTLKVENRLAPAFEQAAARLAYFELVTRGARERDRRRLEQRAKRERKRRRQQAGQRR